MSDVIIIIRVNLNQSLIAKAIFPFFAFFLSLSSVKSQIMFHSILDKLDPRKFATSIAKKAEKLKDKVLKFGGSDAELPDLKPNNQKTKRLFIILKSKDPP